jgi:hypothetical protein
VRAAAPEPRIMMSQVWYRGSVVVVGAVIVSYGTLSRRCNFVCGCSGDSKLLCAGMAFGSLVEI